MRFQLKKRLGVVYVRGGVVWQTDKAMARDLVGSSSPSNQETGVGSVWSSPYNAIFFARRKYVSHWSESCLC